MRPLYTKALCQSSNYRAALPQDKLRFAEWFDEHREELTPSTGEQRSEIRRRADELLAQPRLAEPLTPEFLDRLRGKIAQVSSDRRPRLER